MKIPEPGDYVLATKYHDGDPGDPWAVGVVSEVVRDKFYLQPGPGIRAGGFWRARRISGERGKWLLDHAEDIQYSGFTVWHFLRVPMQRGATP